MLSCATSLRTLRGTLKAGEVLSPRKKKIFVVTQRSATVKDLCRILYDLNNCESGVRPKLRLFFFGCETLRCAGLGRNHNSNTSRLRLDTQAKSYLVSMACTSLSTSLSAMTHKLFTEAINKHGEEKEGPGNYSTSPVYRALE